MDEVWETGETMTEVLARVRAAGGTPVSAVIHYKPGRSRVAGTPDHWAATVDELGDVPVQGGRLSPDAVPLAAPCRTGRRGRGRGSQDPLMNLRLNRCQTAALPEASPPHRERRGFMTGPFLEAQ